MYYFLSLIYFFRIKYLKKSTSNLELWNIPTEYIGINFSVSNTFLVSETKEVIFVSNGLIFWFLEAKGKAKKEKRILSSIVTGGQALLLLHFTVLLSGPAGMQCLPLPSHSLSCLQVLSVRKGSFPLAFDSHLQEGSQLKSSWLTDTHSLRLKLPNLLASQCNSTFYLLDFLKSPPGICNK